MLSVIHGVVHGSIFIDPAQPTDNCSMHINSFTAFKQLTAFQSYLLTVMPPSDLSVLENVQSKTKL